MDVVGVQYRSMLPAAILICFVILCRCRCSLATPLFHNSSESDRKALLCLKSHIKDPSQALSSWRSDSLSFCGWRGVSCSTRHVVRVVALDLVALNITGQIPPCISDLHFLQRIDMSYNQINGRIPLEIGNLTRLRHLNLSMNSITGVIPDTISSCSRLEAIRLMNNSIQGEIPPSLGQLQLLQEITLSNNNLSGTIPSGIGLLPSLRYLFLPSNNLVGSIPESLGSSPSLAMVVVRNNSLTGGIPPMLANCSSLYFLDLMKNMLSGNIPSTMFNSSSLVIIELAYNNFSGTIPSLSTVSSPVQYISLTRNNLSGHIPDAQGNFSQLSTLLIAQNNLQGSIPESLARIPGLQALDVAYNNLSGAVPRKLYNISSLNYLGLGVNNLAGKIPSYIGYTLPNIQTLDMAGNYFEGPLPVSLVHAPNLQALELRGNGFSGMVPSYWSLPNLIQLDLGANQLETVDWSSLSSATSSTELQLIYLDNNKLEGTIPNSVGNLSRSLQQLFLTENNFTGTIPPEIGNLANLTVLQLEGNSFTGGIPDTLGNLRNLFVLSLAHNKLVGKIPESVGRLERLSELYLQENNLSGSIPPSLGGCKSLVILNLSHNVFQGSIPTELLSVSSLSGGLDLSYNKLTGPISSNIGELINLGSLDISNNELSGEIPHTLGECLHLESISLEVNLLHGSIPLSFTNLRGITKMDLSQNNLSGEIPSFFESFSTLQLLNLSFNNLEGVVPTGGVFKNSSKVFLQGNQMLCSSDMMLQLPHCPSTPSTIKRNFRIILIVFPVTSVVMVLIVCATTILYKKSVRSKNHFVPSCKELKKFSYSDLATATNEFSQANLVGSGRFGCVYKGTFKYDLHPYAVKVFKLDQLGAPKNFFVECEALRNTRHRNLIRVISLCSSLDQMGNEFSALILEFMGNGNLENWLHSEVHTQKKKKTLNLGSRIMIAMDIAAALDYLHNWCTPPLVHCDLKPSNVLLDDDMVAHVSDFGLAKFLHDSCSVTLNSSTNVVGPRGSVGYIAPEYGMGCQISTAGDVYSYGVILLEMLTGKHPTDDIFIDGLNLHKFVESAFPQNVNEILETSLDPEFDVEEARQGSNKGGMEACILQLAKLGLKCSVDSPKDRPAIQDVYSEVVTVKEAFYSLCN
ncbi:unnamed protein product [Urochloa decumbens]|uniref:Receptor kinase-like protein Xa21 n=1 Tax=Urochloa decumbens TaxID=240449 RepID=A0ABC9ALS2_9POAL